MHGVWWRPAVRTAKPMLLLGPQEGQRGWVLERGRWPCSAGCLKKSSGLWLSNGPASDDSGEGAEVVSTLTSCSVFCPVFCQGFPLAQKESVSKESLCHDRTNDVLETFLNFNVILLFLILAFCIFKNLPELVYISFDDSRQDIAGALVPPCAR